MDRIWWIVGGVVAVLILLLVIANQRTQLENQRNLAEKWEGNYKVAADVNKQNAATLDKMQQTAQANDELIKQVASDVEDIRLRGSQTRETIREIYRNDPAAADWSSKPVPAGVRDALKGRSAARQDGDRSRASADQPR